MEKARTLLSGYDCHIDDQMVQAEIERISREVCPKNTNVEVYKRLFNSIDLTTLNTTDSNSHVTAFTEKVNSFATTYPELPNVASICVFPNRVAAVKSTLTAPNVGITAVSAGFPTSQTFIEVKIAETALAVAAGATEIDIVQSVGDYYQGDYDTVCEEIAELKEACRGSQLKVILETGALATGEDIMRSSLLAMISGADFIKTSTGKVSPAATPEAAYVMCKAIRAYYDKTGITVGFKPAGGVANSKDGVLYYSIVEDILGERWLNNTYFRIGASRAANAILSDIVGHEVAHF